jgi:3-isopropylmalate dehydrogenase
LATRSPRIAVIAGDGIGPEVVDAALEVLTVADRIFGIGMRIEKLDYGAERFLRDGTTLPSGEIERLRTGADAIFLGALGDPRVPDMRHGREILLALRFELDLFVNFRPVRCLAERLCPLKGKSAKDVDFVVFRENTEGAYVGMGGNFKKGTADEVAINEDLNTRKGVERIIRAAFEYARDAGKTSVVMADKSNALRFAHDLWQRVFAEVSRDYPAQKARHLFVDALVMEMVRAPEQFEVIVTNNMFGDIVTDLGAQLQGGMGIAASASYGKSGPGLFEPVHGSAPPLAGKNVANPLAAILTVELMLRRFGYMDAAAAVGRAAQAAIDANEVTQDLGGSRGTRDVGRFVADAVARQK